MKAVLRRLLVLLAIVAVSMPATFVTTFALLPLWSWIESRYGIESVGHSGPADWCFETVYGVFVGALLLGYSAAARRRRARV